MNHEDKTILLDTTERLFEAHDPTRSMADADDASFPAALWSQLEEVGLLNMLVAESQGGIACGTAIFADVLRIAGRSGAAGPIVETIVARWLMGRIGHDAPAGPLALAMDGWTNSANKISATVRCGNGPASDCVVLVVPTDRSSLIDIVALNRFSVAASRNIAGERLYTLKGEANTLLRSAATFSLALAQQVIDLLSLGRAALIVGALERAMEMSLTYSSDRIQFGQPIAKFQAVQQLLASLAGAVAAASAITSSAARACDSGGGGALLDAARIRLCDAVDTVTAIAHQVHGAIGITREYSLQYFTRRLWAWREEGANLADVCDRFGRRFSGCDADELWPRLVSVSNPAPLAAGTAAAVPS
jgi:acyl-CoA dehydrogenase